MARSDEARYPGRRERQGLSGRDAERKTAPLHWPADVQGLRSLREEAELRSQPEPLHGRHEAPLRPESPARAGSPTRQAHSGIRLHPLPQGRQGPEGRLAAGQPTA